MKKHNIRQKRWIENYEKYIIPLREEYYKNIIRQENYGTYKNTLFLLNYLPFIISIIVLLIGKFSILNYILGWMIIILGNIIIRVLAKFLHLENTNKYLIEVQKQGFFSIEDYESKIKEYITGPNGYYKQLLEEIKEKYNINDQTTRKIFTTDAEECYIWTNTKQDKINLLSTKTNKRPNIETIKLANIRYFRVDNEKKCIILKTDLKIYYFKPNALEILNEIMKNKRLENIKTFTPEVYINDFELFMHNTKKKLSSNNIYEVERFTKNMNIMILISILSVLTVGLTYLIPAYKTIMRILTILFFFAINNATKEITSYKAKKEWTEEEYIKVINNDSECINQFNELKYALGISNQYDKVYTPERACYLTWMANGYFHVFLNMIYFNVVYMAIKASDVRFYKVESNTCEIKLKDKTLIFTNDAAPIFAKLLPNKDYEWLKGYQKK